MTGNAGTDAVISPIDARQRLYGFGGPKWLNQPDIRWLKSFRTTVQSGEME